MTGYNPQERVGQLSVHFWRGGEWKLRDITNYMTTAAFSLVEARRAKSRAVAARFYEIGKEAVRPRKEGELFGFIIPYKTGGEVALRNREMLTHILRSGGVEITYARPFKYKGVNYEDETAIIRMDQPYGAFAKALLETQSYPNLRDNEGRPIPPYDVTAHTLPLLMGVEVAAARSPIVFRRQRRISGQGSLISCDKPPTYALYRSFVPSMDEGWTRWTFDSRKAYDTCFNYERVTDREIRTQALGKYAGIVIPDQPVASILNGYARNRMPEEFTGGLGQEGVKALREFAEKGGTLVFLNRASDFAIQQFKLPLRDVVAGLPRSNFYVPGSILRLELDTSHPLAAGMPKESIAWVEESPVFEVVKQSTDGVTPSDVKIIGWYPRDKDPLLSGWLLGGDRIRGKAALVEVKMGQGRIILFGFRPQYRAQSLATYPLFFNALRVR